MTVSAESCRAKALTSDSPADVASATRAWSTRADSASTNRVCASGLSAAMAVMTRSMFGMTERSRLLEISSQNATLSF